MNQPEQSQLGRNSAYVDQYDASLLFPIPRSVKREELGIQSAPIFFGADLWTAFELSWLNLKGKPQVALAHIMVPAERQVLDLALEVASQVIRGTVATRSEALLPVIREAISALPLHHTHVLLHLNPADASVVREQIGEQLTLTGTQIIDDAAISQGGCLLKAGTSEIDATIETRWKRVLEAIGSEPREWLTSP